VQVEVNGVGSLTSSAAKFHTPYGTVGPKSEQTLSQQVLFFPTWRELMIVLVTEHAWDGRTTRA
jgi:hypothetical protein